MSETSWYRDAAFYGQLPWRYRLIAGYSRCAEAVLGAPRGASRLRDMLYGARRRSGRRGLARVEIRDVTAVIDLYDRRMPLVYRELAGFDPDAELLARLLGSGGTFIDIGANHGTFSLAVAKRMSPPGAVIAFEPQERLSWALAESARLSGLTAIEVHRAALGAEEATMGLRAAESSGEAYLDPAAEPDSTGVVVHVLDEVLRERVLESPVAVKLDVEGFEVPVLLGAAKTIRKYAPLVVLEVSPTTALRAGYPVPRLVQVLTDLGYAAWSTAEHWPRVFPWFELDQQRQQNVVAVPRQYRETVR